MPDATPLEPVVPLLELASDQPVVIARQILPLLGPPTPISIHGELHTWENHRWTPHDDDWLDRALWRLLASATVPKGTRHGEVRVRLSLDATIVRNIRKAVIAFSEIPITELPAWIGSPPHGFFLPTQVMVFRSHTVNVWAAAHSLATTGSYDLAAHTTPRSPSWIGDPVIATDFDPAATCPTWNRCLLEWGHGDPVWGETLERFFAACLMPYREWARILVQYGITRSGKGTTTRILRALSPHTFVGTSVHGALHTHASAILASATTLLFSEVGELDNYTRNSFASLLRTIVGNDPTTINQKHVRIKGGVYRCMPIVQSHYILDLPNEQGGLSSKYLPLHFRASFRDAPDLSLFEKLQAELPGIALRLAHAAVRLVAASPSDRWPVTDASRELQRRIEIESNPIDAFLNFGFAKVPGVHTLRSGVRTQRTRFENLHGVKLRYRDGRLIPDNKLLQEIEERNSWGVVRARNNRTGEWGLLNCAMRIVDADGVPIGQSAVPATSEPIDHEPEDHSTVTDDTLVHTE